MTPTPTVAAMLTELRELAKSDDRNHIGVKLQFKLPPFLDAVQALLDERERVTLQLHTFHLLVGDILDACGEKRDVDGDDWKKLPGVFNRLAKAAGERDQLAAELERVRGELAKCGEDRKHFKLLYLIYGPDDETPDDEDDEPVPPPMIDDLPELDEKEKEVLDAMTPDLVDRLWRNVKDRINSSENECQRVDAMAKSIVDYGETSMMTSPKDAIDLSLRLLSLRESYESMRRSACDKWRRAITSDKVNVELRSLLLDVRAVVEGSKEVADVIVASLEDVGNQTEWKDGDETDRVYPWYEIEPLDKVCDALAEIAARLRAAEGV